MSGTTTNGWPYVTPDDHPKEYPAASQQLAEKLNTVVDPAGYVSLLPTQRGFRLVASTITTDSAGNADAQFGAATFTAPPVVVATPLGPTALFCTITQVTTDRVYATVRDAAGAVVEGIPVHFLIFGDPA